MTPKPDPMPLDPNDPQDATVIAERRQGEFDAAWKRVAEGSGAIVREVHGGRVHMHSRAGADTVFTIADLAALEAAVALLRTRGGV